MSNEADHVVLEFLSFLERREVALLHWGVVDAGFTRVELNDLVGQFLDGQSGQLEPQSSARKVFADSDQLLDVMEARGLLYQFQHHGVVQFRTRMAETVRLLARLRQIFRGQPWQTGRRLVADYRLQIRARPHPRRTIDSDDLIRQLDDSPRLDLRNMHRHALSALLTTTDPPTRLATFQADATQLLLEQVASGKPAGLMVAAGTGGGKTLAFYLPALTWITHSVAKDPDVWTRALALYPRTELLKDQLRSAFIQARRLDGVLATTGGRKLTLGAWFASTPINAQAVLDGHTAWARTDSGYVCPYLVCPDCNSELQWLRADLTKRLERLVCRKASCQNEVTDKEFTLTRDAISERPPDVLFTTTESLNRQLATPKKRHIFGVGGRHHPRLMLLDEVHTYEGTTGAHTALLLRRWRHAVKGAVTFVGLSATLQDAERFFAELTGLQPDQVVQVQPNQDQLEHLGMEYLIALRNDPGTMTSPLSTSIQTAMLIGRVLDPPTTELSKAKSQGVYGQRAFVFTDKLDVTNRLYWDLLDAEGWYRPGRPRRSTPRTLANIRAPGEGGYSARWLDGQSWDFPNQIGHAVDGDQQLRVGRTTSQDAGVEAGADLIVATAALEVGFDDNTVGAVIQHKAPHDAARFLQRKGRAGRDLKMRPWTVVVLSDWGRDRVTYQTYDQFFSPELAARSLPVRNRYVLRMQAVYAFLDWLAIYSGNQGSPWRYLAEPVKNDSYSEYNNSQQQRVVNLIQEILSGGRARHQLANHLQQALRLDDDELQAVLWEPPRALLSAVLPTLLRRLTTGWRNEQPSRTPLPEFITPNLFSDLLVPEAEVTATPTKPNRTNPSEYLGVDQAIREFCAGNVTRRFGVVAAEEVHWVPIPNTDDARIDALYDLYPLGEFDYLDDDGHRRSVHCYQPRKVTLDVLPPEISDRSLGRPLWHSTLKSLGNSTNLALPSRSRWSAILTRITSHLHAQGGKVLVRRFSTGAECSLQRANGERTHRRVRFTAQPNDEVVDAALGFEMHCDGLRLHLRYPDALSDPATLGTPRHLAALRTNYFQHVVATSNDVPPEVSVFQRYWLANAFLAALAQERAPNEADLQPAWTRIQAAGDLPARLTQVLNVIYAGDEETEADEETGVLATPAGTSSSNPARERIAALCQRSDVLDGLRQAAPVLWEPPTSAWQQWLQCRFRTTVAAAFVEASARLCPDVDVDGLIVDVDPQHDHPPHPQSIQVWITESTPGGAGVLERVVHTFNQDPTRFLRVMERAVAPTDLELLDHQLRQVLHHATTSPEIQSAIAKARSAWPAGHEAVRLAFRALQAHLAARGLPLSRAARTAVNARLLAPGTTADLDQLLTRLLRRWDELESACQVEFDGRLFAYLNAEDARVDDPLRLNDTGQPTTASRRFGVLSNLFWPRGSSVRAQALTAPNRYATPPPTDRELVERHLNPGLPTINASDPDAATRLRADLAQYGQAVLASDDRAKLRRQLLAAATRPVDLGYLLGYPRAIATTNVDARLLVTLDLLEANR